MEKGSEVIGVVPAPAEPMQLDTIHDLKERVQDQAEQIQAQKRQIEELNEQLRWQKQETEKVVRNVQNSIEDDVELLKRELIKHQQANLAFQKALREIGTIITAVANGDLSKKILIHQQELDPEIKNFKRTINTMVDQLQEFATQVTTISRQVGTEGRLGGEASVPNVNGIWLELQNNVNAMVFNLTTQVREISKVTTAVAQGDLTQKVTAVCSGEVQLLKDTINSMVDRLRLFASEVSSVAQQVGIKGILGGQAQVVGEGKWKDLTDNVNIMALRLTDQVRSISEVTQAIARGDMSRKIHVECEGEVLLLKDTINDMVDRLDKWSLEMKQVARDVGVNGVLGGQAELDDRTTGRWREITLDVNKMASNLTSQVRAFSAVTSGETGEITKEITIEASGEMDELKRKINKMVSGLRESMEKNRKAREVAELANKTKSEFLANMSHEIRTPMNGIIGMTQLTLDTDLATPQRDMLNTVHNLANSLLTIIDDILDISKIEANRMDLEQIPFSLRGTVFNALKTLAVKANERFLNLAYQVDSSVPDFVVGDSFRLRQIIVNLVGNAIKFTERGEVKVTIGNCSQEGCGINEYAIQFAVSDTGIGIHGDKLTLIFDTFQQADGSTTRRFGGTGLGLSISKKLVNLMGGNMWVESEYGQGSTFFFTCKVRLANTHVSAIGEQLQPYKKHTVLFIDQGRTGCGDEIEAALEQLELIPIRIKSGDEGPPPVFPSVNGHAYDCVIVDSNETARRLRGVEKFKYIPFVMLAPVVSVSFKSALEDGISSYMTTPCLPIDLGNALIPALEGRATPSVDGHSRSFDILLAEDNLVNQKLAVKILEKYNHSVTVAHNGLEAYERIKTHQYDVVLMDVQMPIMGGFEATSKIREFERLHKLSSTPIIALTAHAMVGDREMCIQAQMDDYLSKPLKQNQLIQTIFKCATLRSPMMEQKTKSRRSMVLDGQRNGGIKSGPASPTSPARPSMGRRGVTEHPHGIESPDISTADQPDPIGILIRSHSDS